MTEMWIRPENVSVLVYCCSRTLYCWITLRSISVCNVFTGWRSIVLQEEQYARWLAAFRLASKGRTMADSSYDGEVKTIHELLHMQHPNPAMALSPHEVVVMPENLLAPRFLKKLKSKQV